VIINLTIASLNIRLQAEEGITLMPGERFSAFVSSGTGEPDLVLKVNAGRAYVPVEAREVFRAPLVEEGEEGPVNSGEPFWSVSESNDTVYVKAHVKDPGGEPLIIIPAGKTTWHIFLDQEGEVIDPLPYPVDGLLLYYLVSWKSGIMIHASGVISGGNGWLFSGRSGRGKTTMARIFDGCGDRVIHDDRLILLKGKDGWMMHSTPVYRNDEPRNGVISHLWIIGHGDSNISVPVSGAEAAGLVLANSIQQNWDRRAAERLAAAAEDLVGSVEVSTLLFVPDSRVRDYLLLRKESALGEAAHLAANLLDDRQQVSISAGGYSMWPALRPGDRLIISAVNDNLAPAAGDVVALKRDGGFVVHRITEIKADDGAVKIRTRGDSSMKPDPWIAYEHIAGFVKRFRRGDRELAVAPRRMPFFVNAMLVRAVRLRDLLRGNLKQGHK